MFGWLYRGIAKAVLDEASIYINESLQDPKFQKNMTVLIDNMVDRQKQRVYGQIGAAVRDNPDTNYNQRVANPINSVKKLTNKDGSFNWGKLILSMGSGNQQQDRAQQGSYQNDRKAYKYQ